MTTLAQVTLDLKSGSNFTSWLGFVDFGIAMAYPIILLVTFTLVKLRVRSLETILYIIQALAIPFALIPTGLILLFQAWRLDPALQAGLILLHVPLLLFAVKDFVLLRLVMNEEALKRRFKSQEELI